MSQAPGTDPQDVARGGAAVSDADVPADSPGDSPTATGQPDAGEGRGTSAAVGIPDPVPVPDRQDHPATVQESVPASADPRVDDAVSRLAEIEALPLSEQVAVYTDIHRRLAAVLADPDSRA